MKKKHKITIVFRLCKYVLGVLLAQHNDVVMLDIDATRAELINNNQSTVADTEIAAL